ncbi:hypothetical protein PFICI_12689 [Pestalotiopsis fici W106-1]|uniref:Rhodopsin domain-containing protein n=1 Tax=Pestalotiopsis fici (strain W106-1 / CGMCC3.15140) TaxID=1229662 RepID=W3WPD8_PESFW|nr:uncharacterized protein PFICI_12689 [Pestalotiopsis fici W106-1]ETS75745.1 hypothetical protein PFICI_12689 [Pestalotiopsis fici W106-1]
MTTGYVSKTWDDRMLILITISSCGTTVGQTWSKTAFAVTLLRLIQESQRILIWFCIVTLNVLMVLKVFMNWPKYCGNADYQNYWRMQGFCVDYGIAAGVKVAGNIWNIVMDFALALFPWMVIWKLSIKRWEKIGLCATLSLGILVAIISAIRQAWQNDPANSKLDDWYYWHQGHSMIWYSAEVAGTIMVQCIPVMRTLFGEVNTSRRTGRKLHDDAEEGQNITSDPRSRASLGGTLRPSTTADTDIAAVFDDDGYPLTALRTDGNNNRRGAIVSQVSMTPSEVDRAIEASRTQPLEWPLSGNEPSVIGVQRLEDKELRV